VPASTDGLRRNARARRLKKTAVNRTELAPGRFNGLLGGALDLHLRLLLPGAYESQWILRLPLETRPIGERNPRTSTPGPDVAERRARQRGIERARAEHDKLRKLDWLTPQASRAIRAEATALDSPIVHGDTKPRRLARESPEVLPLRDHGEPEGGSRLALAICAMALIERQRFAGEAIAHRTTKTAPLRVNSHVVAPPNGSAISGVEKRRRLR
jgi:hypothetical protein